MRCTSTGGRVLNMSVTGPDSNYDLTNAIQSFGVLGDGGDSYTATTGNIEGSYGQPFTCTASNGAPPLTGCVGLKGDNRFVPPLALYNMISLYLSCVYFSTQEN